MKKLILIALSCLPVISFAGEDFDRGYELGYKEGYQKIEGQFSIAPISPIPPIPGIGQDTLAATIKASSTGWVKPVSRSRTRTEKTLMRTKRFAMGIARGGYL
jgi:hypothetical protein